MQIAQKIKRKEAERQVFLKTNPLFVKTLVDGWGTETDMDALMEDV